MALPSSAYILTPVILMLAAALVPQLAGWSVGSLWRVFAALCGAALAATALPIVVGDGLRSVMWPGIMQISPLSFGMAVLVQLLGLVVAGFSSRYLVGESGQRRYMSALACALMAVHLLLLADHWLLLVLAWTLVGAALNQLLCFYPERAFARLATHKKRLADRVADGLLIGATVLAWTEVGSGSLSALWAHLHREGAGPALQLCAVVLVLAVVLRSALLPVHGWLIQVMEAPTPVSALLHAGVVNLGGFALIRFAPLLEQAPAARGLLVLFSLVTAVLAGLVMLTRISIKVRLAWSTVAQMGFMLLECGLGLYTLAALHLVGHSLYKAHAFLSASDIVRQTRLQAMRAHDAPLKIGMMLAPVLSVGTVLLLQTHRSFAILPWWWSVSLGLAWAPLLWLPAATTEARARLRQVLSGIVMVAALTAMTLLAHRLPIGIEDSPDPGWGPVALLGLLGLYGALVLLHAHPEKLETWRRWSYAGFYVDEACTRLALHLWPISWAATSAPSRIPQPSAELLQRGSS